MSEWIKSAGGLCLLFLIYLRYRFCDSPCRWLTRFTHLRHGADIAHVLDVDGEVVGWDGVAETHVGVERWGLGQPFVAVVRVGVVEGAFVRGGVVPHLRLLV